MTPLKLAEIEAEKRYPYPDPIQTHPEYSVYKLNEMRRAAFIAGDQRDRWIRVEDGMPPNKTECLVFYGGNVFLAYYNNLEFKPRYIDSDFAPGLLTHWQKIVPPSNP